jgi:hypothetical protein
MPKMPFFLNKNKTQKNKKREGIFGILTQKVVKLKMS